MGTLGRYEASINTKERPRNPRCRREAGVSTTRAPTVQGTPTRPTRAPPPASPPATPTPTPTAPPTTTTGEGMASTPPPPAAPRPRGASRTPPTPTTTVGPQLQLQPRASRQGRARQGPGGAPLLSTARCGARTARRSLSSEVASDLSKTWLAGP